MRAPFQIRAISYKLANDSPLYCIFHRTDFNQWQFIAGGGKDNETSLESAKRETLEEGGVQSGKWLELKSLSYIPSMVISEKHRQHWSKDTYVIPEYIFAFECDDDIKLFHEHNECV